MLALLRVLTISIRCSPVLIELWCRALLLDGGGDQLFGLIAHMMRNVSRLDDPDSIVQFGRLRSLTHEDLTWLARDSSHALIVFWIPWTFGRVSVFVAGFGVLDGDVNPL